LAEFHSAGGDIKANTFLQSKQTHGGSEFRWKGNQVSLLWQIICHFSGLIVYISESDHYQISISMKSSLLLCVVFLCVACVLGSSVGDTKTRHLSLVREGPLHAMV
jgi:hypothetical protein